MILRVDKRQFPAAFAPEGREARAALRDAIEELANAGALRLVRHGGYATGEPKELRLGPPEVEPAYRLAREEGFQPLATALATLAAHARRLTASAPWMLDYLKSIADGAAMADLAPLGMQRDRLKRDLMDVLDALTAAARLADGVSGWERIVSERIFAASKRLGAVRSLVIDILVRADPRWDGIRPDDAADLLQAYGVRRKPGLLRCAGAAEMRIGERVYQLADFVPTAHLPDAWSDAWIDGIARSGARLVTLIENEFPFLSYVEDAGGPRGLAHRGEVVVYVAGFPTPRLTKALSALTTALPGAQFQHWGDSDVGGLRIWWLLRNELGRSLQLFRMDPDWLAEQTTESGRPLSESELRALAKLKDLLMTQTNSADIDQACCLIDVLLQKRFTVEQERY